MKKFAFLGLVVGVVLGASACATVSQTKKVVRDSVELADDACVLLRDVAPDNQRAREICVRAEELRPLIDLLLRARAKAAAADAGSD